MCSIIGNHASEPYWIHDFSFTINLYVIQLYWNNYCYVNWLKTFRKTRWFQVRIMQLDYWCLNLVDCFLAWCKLAYSFFKHKIVVYISGGLNQLDHSLSGELNAFLQSIKRVARLQLVFGNSTENQKAKTKRFTFSLSCYYSSNYCKNFPCRPSTFDVRS